MENEIDVFENNKGKKCKITVAFANGNFNGVQPAFYFGEIQGSFKDFVVLKLEQEMIAGTIGSHKGMNHTVFVNKTYIIAIEFL